MAHVSEQLILPLGLAIERFADAAHEVGKRFEAFLKPGDRKYLMDKDGKTPIYSIIGRAYPKWTGTFSSTIAYKGWDFSFDINVHSMHRTIRAFLPGMLKKGKGSIVNIASGASSVRGIPNRFIYGATKAAVIGLTKSVAADFMRQGIRCNAINPGTIQSPSLDDRIAAQAKAQNKSLDEIRQAFIDRQPMARLGTPETVADLAAQGRADELRGLGYGGELPPESWRK